MDSTFFRCREEDGYQQLLALLLAEVRQSLEVFAVVSSDLLEWHEDFGNLYYVAGRSYWAREFPFESCVCECQKSLV